MNALFHANLGITDFWTFLLGTIFIVILRFTALRTLSYHCSKNSPQLR